MALEGVRQQQRDQMGVVLEADAEHLVRLALVPGGARVDAHGGRQDGGIVRDGRTEQQASHRSVAECGDVGADAEAGARFVDGAQPVEVGAAQHVAGRFQGLGPGGGGDVHGEQVVRVRRGGVRAEDVGDGVGQPVVGLRGGHFRSSPGVFGAATSPLRRAAAEGRGVSSEAYRSASDSRAIFSWSLRIPWRSASGRGGQPGT